MPKHSRRYHEVRNKVDRYKQYMPDAAVELVRESATAKFNETVEVHLTQA